MAEINFFFSQAERDDFVSFCFTNNFVIIPDYHYEDNCYYVIKNLEHYHMDMDECVGFFIVHDRFKQYPLEMDFFEKDGKKNTI